MTAEDRKTAFTAAVALAEQQFGYTVAIKVETLGPVVQTRIDIVPINGWVAPSAQPEPVVQLVEKP